jgi:hypothetical protein
LAQIWATAQFRLSAQRNAEDLRGLLGRVLDEVGGLHPEPHEAIERAYGIGVSEPVLDYSRLLARVREVVSDVRTNSSLRPQLDSLGATVHEHAAVASFTNEHTIETECGLSLQAEKFIANNHLSYCSFGIYHRISVPPLTGMARRRRRRAYRAGSASSRFASRTEEDRESGLLRTSHAA